MYQNQFKQRPSHQQGEIGVSRVLTLLLYLILFLTKPAFANEQLPGEDEGFAHLEREIDRILKETETPGAAVAMLRPDGSIWTYTAGFAQVEERKPIEPQTIFRVGSISKTFVSLAVMKLIREGKLSLQGRVSDLAPELEFENPWEKDHPLRLVHLLNHTSGWDAPHFPELMGRAGEPVSIAEMLSLHPHSRKSRWVPGTRSAYNNTGPLAAAYIVEKVTETRFEDYVQQYFFEPLGMNQSGYFYDDHYRAHATEMFHGKETVGYWHLGNRAAGGLHSSLGDLMKLLHFMQKPDEANIESSLTRADIGMLETPKGSSASDAGLEVGWGLGLTSFHHDGLVYYGHEGSMPGASAVFGYGPRPETGHVVLLNRDGPALSRIHGLLMDFASRHYFASEGKATEGKVPPEPKLSGLYRSISPIAERSTAFSNLISWKIQAAENSVMIAPLVGGRPKKLLAVERGEFVQPQTGRVALVKTVDPLEGEVLQYGPMTLKKVSPVAAYGPILMLAGWILLALVAFLYVVYWGLRYLFSPQRYTVSTIRLRAWPLLTVVVLICTAVALKLSFNMSDPFAMAGRVTVFSALVFVGSLLFLAFSLWSVRVWLRDRKAVEGRFGKWHSTGLIALNLCVALYMLAYGLIGIRLWA